MQDVEGWPTPTPEENEAAQREIEKSRAAAFEAISAEPPVNFEPVHRVEVLFGFAVPRPRLIAERHELPEMPRPNLAAHQPTPKPPNRWERAMATTMEIIDALCGIRKADRSPGGRLGQKEDARKQDERHGK